MLDSNALTALHDHATAAWHADPKAALFSATPILVLALEQHHANYDLWHQEDAARNPQAADRTIAEVKHEIDRLNQLRNDRVEQIDQLLLTAASPQNEAAPLHSETPGLIVDRLSILSLKRYHTAEESCRGTASAAHRERNRERLHILELQREDLAGCLARLWQEILAGQRRFKLYRQLKMYNDPELNPVLYGVSAASTAGR